MRFRGMRLLREHEQLKTGYISRIAQNGLRMGGILTMSRFESLVTECFRSEGILAYGSCDIRVSTRT
jgi:hypothetical protein